MSKDYERKVQTSETLIQVAMIRLLLARLECESEPVPTGREDLQPELVYEIVFQQRLNEVHAPVNL